MPVDFTLLPFQTRRDPFVNVFTHVGLDEAFRNKPSKLHVYTGVTIRVGVKILVFIMPKGHKASGWPG